MDPGAVISKEEFKEIKRAATLQAVIDLCEAHPFWSTNPNYYESGPFADGIKDFYLTKGEDGTYQSIRWDRIHGKKRKVLKFEIKKRLRQINEQYTLCINET